MAQEAAVVEKKAALAAAKAKKTAKKGAPAPAPVRGALLPDGSVGSVGSVGSLPDGWEEHTSKTTGEVYWLNTITWESVFERPVAAATGARGATNAARMHTSNPRHGLISRGCL